MYDPAQTTYAYSNPFIKQSLYGSKASHSQERSAHILEGGSVSNAQELSQEGLPRNVIDTTVADNATPEGQPNTQLGVVDDYEPQASSNQPTRLKVGRTSYSILTAGKGFMATTKIVSQKDLLGQSIQRSLRDARNTSQRSLNYNTVEPGKTSLNQIVKEKKERERRAAAMHSRIVYL